MDIAWREQVAKELIIRMLANPENTPSVAKGTAVKEEAAAIEEHSVSFLCYGSSSHMMLCHDGAKQIAQELRQLRDIDRDPPRLIFAEQLCCRLLKASPLLTLGF